MSENVVAFGCTGQHAWGEITRAELVECGEWMERATCKRCGAHQEAYFDNGEEVSRQIRQA